MEKRTNRWQSLLALGAMLAAVGTGFVSPPQASAAAFAPGQKLFAANQQQTSSEFFPQTGKSVEGPFLDYWSTHGGLAQQGYPISNGMQEQSDTDGRTYTVQYFERAEFEYHPENPAPNNVLLSLLGAQQYATKYPSGAPGQQPDTSFGSILFTETGHRLGGLFLDYWSTQGGLAQLGYPISDPFVEVSALDGNPYVVQYFERAVLEWHPELRPSSSAPYDILLSQLGTYRFTQKYGAAGSTGIGTGTGTGAPIPVVPVIPTPAPPATPATGVDQSSNWSGYAATGGTFTSVSGTWTIPNVSAGSGYGVAADATWVGIGGVNTTDLIQAGTQATVQGGQVQYSAWVETLPQTSQTISLDVKAGDNINVAINQQSDGTWQIVMRDLTSGQSFQKNLSYNSSLSSAEWIEEAPSSSRGTLPLDQFGAVNFSQGTAVENGQQVTIAQANGKPISMYTSTGLTRSGRFNRRSGQVGQLSAQPSVLGPDGASFVITRMGS